MSNLKNNRFCIFCGDKPTDKNREHVIPQWLINLTGDKKRPFSLFLLNNDKEYIKNNNTPFDNFVFPACTSCNNEYSDLENKASIVVNSILNKENLNQNDFITLLDWLDKIRIGMWLAIMYRDNNAFQIEPNFYISQRLRKSDRLVRITRTSHSAQRLTISGVNTPAFMRMPSAFSLTINQFSLISVSDNFLLSRRMGWPYPNKQIFHENGLFECDMNQGLERLIHPIIRLPIDNTGTTILQSIIPSEVYKHQKSLYESKYIFETRLDNHQNLSKIYIQKHNLQAKVIVSAKNKEWIPSEVDLSSNAFCNKSGCEALKIQNKLLSDVMSMEFNSVDHKRKFKRAFNTFKKFNVQQINSIKNQKYIE